MSKSKEGQTRKAVDSHFASNRTQELMYQIQLFRDRQELSPLKGDEQLYRKECLKPMTPGNEYRIVG